MSSNHIVTIADAINSTATVDIREIAAITHDIEGYLSIVLKSGQRIHLDEVDIDAVEHLEHEWRKLP